MFTLVVRENLFLLTIVDNTFHINRILALSESWKNGMFGNGIEFFTIGGYGYANPTFYGNIFLIPFAFLSYLGVSNVNVVLTLIFTTMFSGFLISYFMSKAYFKNNKQAILFSIFYTLNPLMLHNYIIRGAYGEIIATVLLPIAFFTFLNILKDPKYKQWYLLPLGVLFILLSHQLSFVITVVFFIIIYLLQMANSENKWDKTKVFIKSGIAFIGMAIFQLLPMFVIMKSQEINVGNVLVFYPKVQGYPSISIFIVELFQLFGNFSLHITLGVIGLASIVLCFGMFKKMDTLDKQLFFTSLSLIFFKFVLMDTGFLNDSFFATMQFGWRVYTIVIPVLILLLLQNIMKFEKINKRNITISLITIYFLFTSVFSVIYLSYNREQAETYSDLGTGELHSNNYYKKNINEWTKYTSHIGTGLEYLPTTFYPLEYMLSEKFLPDGSIGLISNNNTTTFSKENKGYGKLEAKFNSSNYDSIVAPFIYYKHYYNVQVNGEKVSYQQSEDGYIEIIIPEIMDGELIIQYQTPWFVTLSRIFSFISLLIFSFVIFTEHRKKDLV